MNTQYLIKNAYAILTGLSGDAARSSATDIRIQHGKISALDSSVQNQKIPLLMPKIV